MTIFDAIMEGNVERINSFLHPSWPCMSCGKKVFEYDKEGIDLLTLTGLCRGCWEEREMERDYKEMEARA